MSKNPRAEEIRALWKNEQLVKGNSDLLHLLSRKRKYGGQLPPGELLATYNYPDRTKISDTSLVQRLDGFESAFIKGDSMILLRGDYPNQQTSGFYSIPFALAGMSTMDLARTLKGPNEVGCFLFKDEIYLNDSVKYESIESALVNFQSCHGQSSFISATTSLPCAIDGTGNQTSQEVRDTFEIYVLKIPLEYVIRTPEVKPGEKEYMVPDFIRPEEVLQVFSAKDKDGIIKYLESLGIPEKELAVEVDYF